MSNFILAGAAGFIAPKHLEAIKKTGNNLLAVVDPCDSVGILDRYFPDTQYFSEFERFDRYLDLLMRSGEKIDYLVVCSPNYLHDAHCRFGLRIGVDVVCEKPLVISPRNLIALQEDEKRSGKRIYPILQTRLHPEIIALKESLSGVRLVAPPYESKEASEHQHSECKYKVKLQYYTYRGPWYRYSWKGDSEKSGGLLMNIGVHFMDLFTWMFGQTFGYGLEVDRPERSKGQMWFMDAHVEWDLRLDCHEMRRTLTVSEAGKGERVIDFTKGFTDLHLKSYQEILKGQGFDIADARPSIEFVNELSGKEQTWLGDRRGEWNQSGS